MPSLGPSNATDDRPKLPLTFYRVMCGRKAHSHWLDSEQQAFKAAIAKRLASIDRRGAIFLGPLVWIQPGRRSRSKARTVPLEASDNLPLRNRPVWSDPA